MITLSDHHTERIRTDASIPHTEGDVQRAEKCGKEKKDFVFCTVRDMNNDLKARTQTLGFAVPMGSEAMGK